MNDLMTKEDCSSNHKEISENINKMQISIIREINDLRVEIAIMKVKTARTWGIVGSVFGSVLISFINHFLK